MSPAAKLHKTPHLIGVILVALGRAGAASDTAAGVLPKDPCALLEPAEIQTLDAQATGSGVADDSMAPIGTGCTYRWGPKTAEWGDSYLTVVVIDAAKGWPGVDPKLIRQGLLMKVKAGGANASQVAGVGDTAVFTFEERPSNATVEAYFQAKGIHVALTYHAGGSRSSKDKIVALLKAASTRL